jgi:DNA-binding CsgD family transcriptional regulator
MDDQTTETPGRQLQELQSAIISLHEAEIDLEQFPSAVIRTIHALIKADFVGYGVTLKDAVNYRDFSSQMPKDATQITAQDSLSDWGHLFWTAAPRLPENPASTESDFSSQCKFKDQAMDAKVFKPLGVQRWMRITIPAGPAIITFVCFCSGRSFDKRDRQTLQVLRRHFHSIYQIAHLRSVAKLDPKTRLRFAFPSFSERQLEVATLLTEGKSNEDIGRLMGLGLEGVKFHIRALFEKLGVDDRVAAALTLVSTQPEFIPFPIADA